MTEYPWRRSTVIPTAYEMDLDADRQFYSIEVSAHFVYYALRGGTAEGLRYQRCAPTTVHGDCTVTLMGVEPTREGYEFLGYSDGTDEYWPGDEVTFVYGTNDLNLTAKWGGGEINWVQGQERKVGDGVDAKLMASYPMEDFTRIKIDGEEVDRSHYTVESGSTVVTVDSEYLDTLGLGEHTLRVAYGYTNRDKSDWAASGIPIPVCLLDYDHIYLETTFTLARADSEPGGINNGGSSSAVDTGVDDGEEVVGEVVSEVVASEEVVAEEVVAVPDTGAYSGAGDAAVGAVLGVASVASLVAAVGFGVSLRRVSLRRK